MRLRYAAFSAIALAAILTTFGRAADDDQVKQDEKLLTDAKQAVTGDGLCEFFRKHTPDKADIKRVPELIAKLGSDDFDVREKATEAIIALGAAAVPLLQKETENPDIEVRSRVRACLDKLETTPTAEWSAAAARLLRDRKPKEALDVLMAYLPWSASDDVDYEVVLTLLAIGVKDGKVDGTLAKALKDGPAATRGAAAFVMAKAGDADQKKLAQEALKDSEPVVRLRAAQGLIAAGDKAGVPILIDLLSDGPLNVATRAEEYLQRIAGEASAPVSLPSKDEKEPRKKCRESWEGWSKKNYESLDLAKVDVLGGQSAAALARETVRKFAEAGCKGDVDKLAKTLDESINVMGIMTIQRDDLVKQMKVSPNPPNQASFDKIKSVKLSDIASDQPGVKEFVNTFAKEKVEAVAVEVTESGHTESMVMVLRMKGGKMLIAGFAPMELRKK